MSRHYDERKEEPGTSAEERGVSFQEIGISVTFFFAWNQINGRNPENHYSLQRKMNVIDKFYLKY